MKTKAEIEDRITGLIAELIKPEIIRDPQKSGLIALAIHELRWVLGLEA